MLLLAIFVGLIVGLPLLFRLAAPYEERRLARIKALIATVVAQDGYSVASVREASATEGLLRRTTLETTFCCELIDANRERTTWLVHHNSLRYLFRVKNLSPKSLRFERR